MHPGFAPTPAESTLVNSIFQQADPQKLGVVTGDAAVKVFDGAKLPPAVLAEIWAMADEDNNGWLGRKGVAKAVRLIGWAQQGRKLSDELLEKPGPLPKIEGITPIAAQNTGMSIPSSPLPLFPALSPQDRDKFTNIFRRAGPVNGLLSGEKARDIFLKSKLPNEQLLQIWNLADTQDRGALDAVDFVIGMFFIHGLMSGTIKFIPTTLPPGLYQQAGGAVASHMSGNSGNFSPSVHSSFSIQPQSTGQRSQMLQPNHTGMSNSSIPPRTAPALPARPSAVASQFTTPAQPAAPAWDVTPAEKLTFDAWFDGLDSQKVNYIEGDVAVPFMLQSKLPGEILAAVWDLSDLNNDGKLTRDGFAVAMHLIQKKLAGVDIPAQLPTTLIPPSMRSRLAPQAQQPPPPVQEPVRDLFSFDDSPPPSAVAPQQTGGFAAMQAQQTGGHPSISAQPTGARSPHPDPFSSAISPSHTGTPRNFLDDDEPAPTAASPPLQDKSAEIGNAKNQLASTTRSLDAARAERAALEETLTNQAAQLSSLQTQLSLAKASYESELQHLSNFKERHSTQQGEIQKTREELIRAESDLSALKVEKAEIEGAFMRDKEDARELHRRMIETGQQSDAIKAEVEKLKKDAKQQKGLLAIAKKQLSSKEAEKAKAEKEFEEAKAELAAVTKEQDEVEGAIAALDAAPASPPPAVPVARSPPVSPIPVSAAVVGSPDSLTFAAAQPLPITPDLTSTSPTVSIKSNNPFDRLKTAGSTTPRSQSPFATFSPSLTQTETNDTFPDDIFNAQAEKAESLEGLAYDAPEASKPAAPELASDLLSPGTSVSPPLTATETEFFHTPPTSAQLSPSVEEKKFPAIDEFTAAFAPVESDKPKADSSSKNNEGEKAKTTDFDSTFNFDDQEHARGLDIPESESDTDSGDDEDEVPLSQIKSHAVAAQAATEKAPAQAQAPIGVKDASAFDDVFGDSQPGKVEELEGAKKVEAQTTGAAPAAQAENTFDDIFGGPVAQTQRANGSAVPAAAEKAAVGPPPVAGVDAFDEALGKISATGSTSQPASAQLFSFDAAFDDNFDFAAAKTDDSTPAPVQQTPQQVASAPPPTNDNFEAIFLASGLNGNGNAAVSENAARRSESAAVPEPGAASTGVGNAISFDDVFSADLAAGLKEPAAAAEPVSPKVSPAPVSQTSSGPSTDPFPPVSPSRSTVSPRPSVGARASSPLQERIPPARAASPKPRLSSSSSKEGQSEKIKEPPTRHSKISLSQLRLPFGRKKKQQQQQQQHEPMPAPPSSHLAAHPEGLERVLTPAVDDDVEAVKQLTSMGFSRSEAVNALEKYGYDVQRALNSLLSAS